MATPLILDIDDFKGDFSFDALFGNLLKEHFPSFQEEDGESPEGTLDAAKLGPGHHPPLFPAVDKLLGLFKDSFMATPLILDIDDFKGDFSFDALFGNLLKEHFPSFQEEDGESPEGTLDAAKLGPGHHPPLFPAVDKLLGLFKDSSWQMVCCLLTKCTTQRMKLEKGVDGLFDSFARLDSRISSVGQTAAKIGDHLQSADSQRETASQTIDLIKYLMDFNSNPGDLLELSPLFSDDSRVAEAASVAQKLRSFAEEDVGKHSVGVQSVAGAANASKGLEVAVVNLQDYCNELENRLLAWFDTASQRRDLRTMAECAKILSQFNRGTSVMQHYVPSRPMFIDVEVMSSDTKLVLGNLGLQAATSNIASGLSSLYREITETVRKEAVTITAVFPSPNDVMSILVQRVLEQRVTGLLDRLLTNPSLVDLPPVEQGGLLQIEELRFEIQQQSDSAATASRSKAAPTPSPQQQISVSVVTEFVRWNEEALSRCILFSSQIEELRFEIQQQSDSAATASRSKAAPTPSPQQQISVSVVTEFVRWNEEALSRCILFSSQPATLATYVKLVLNCLLDQVSQYLTEGLERARESLNEAAALRDKFLIGTSVSRRVAAAAASAAEAAAAAGETSFRSFMIAVQQCASSVAILQQYFSNSISHLLLPVDGAHAASCEEMGTSVSTVESAAHKGLLQCIDTVMAEVERLLSSEQKTSDYRTPDDGSAPDHRPTNACISGGLRLKRDITEYGEYVRSFNAPSIDEKFELLGIMANVFIVAPESLASLFEGTPSIRKDGLRFVQLRDDYKTAKIASGLNNLMSES
ncbi:Exocyst complex component 5 [Cocos nucifera]|uniref:Exocyst complex component 5 n=1 Tax=Cocos nucifera TaxID=13894 RepID=A0A8K0INE0_COCNU|nr:Exocyst complex component 5 [Cocos nucifera]